MDEDAKIEACRGFISMGASIYRKVNSRRGWTANAQREAERVARHNLTAILGRAPSPQEVARVLED